MNRYLTVWGCLVAAGGLTMFLLAGALGQETFFMAAYYVPPAQAVAMGVAAVGVLLFAASFLIEWPRYATVDSTVAARYFARLALANALAAAIFAFAMFVPSLELPILFTKWPGIYIAIGYSSFVGFGVFGMLAWAFVYQMLPTFFYKGLLDRRSVLLQLALSELGVYGVSAVLFAAGFIGATLVEGGLVGSTFVGASMEFSDIPAAVSIFLVIVSVFLGVATIRTGKANE